MKTKPKKPRPKKVKPKKKRVAKSKIDIFHIVDKHLAKTDAILSEMSAIFERIEANNPMAFPVEAREPNENTTP